MDIYESEYGDMIEFINKEWRPIMPDCNMFLYMYEKDWKIGRRSFLCASETASILGFGFTDNVTVWKDKVYGISGYNPPASAKELMEKGKKSEAHIRELFAVDYGLTDVYDGTNILVVNLSIKDKNGNPFMACTLDAWAKDKSGDPFIIEIKRSESPNLFGDDPPKKYRAQVLKQMIVTGIKKACLVAHISFFHPTGTHRSYTREYWFDANDPDVKSDMKGIIKEEERFWNEYVLTKRKPPRRLQEI